MLSAADCTPKDKHGKACLMQAKHYSKTIMYSQQNNGKVKQASCSSKLSRHASARLCNQDAQAKSAAPQRLYDILHAKLQQSKASKLPLELSWHAGTRLCCQDAQANALQHSKTYVMHCKQSCSKVKQASCLSSCHGMQALDYVAKMLKQMFCRTARLMQCTESKAAAKCS